MSRPLPPDALEVVQENRTRAQAAQARECVVDRLHAPAGRRSDLTERPAFMEADPEQQHIALEFQASAEHDAYRHGARHADRIAEWDRRKAEALHARAADRLTAAELAAEVLAALLAVDRLQAEADPELVVVASTRTAVLKRSPPPGALIRSTPIAAHAPPQSVRYRCMSGTVRPSGTPASSMHHLGGI